MIAVGDTFERVTGTGRMRRIDRYRREPDDPSPAFECERIRITHISCSDAPGQAPYTFGTEPEWFRQRGLAAAPTRSAT